MLRASGARPGNSSAPPRQVTGIAASISRGAPREAAMPPVPFQTRAGCRAGKTSQQSLTPDLATAGFRVRGLRGKPKGGVMTEIRRDLSQIERGVETALRNFAGSGANSGGEVPDITAAERIDKIGNMSA